MFSQTRHFQGEWQEPSVATGATYLTCVLVFPTSQLRGRGQGKLWSNKKAVRGGERFLKGRGGLWWEVTVAPKTIWAGTYLREALHILQAAFFTSSSCQQAVRVPPFTSLWADGGNDLPGSHLYHAAPGVVRALHLVPRRPLHTP